MAVLLLALGCRTRCPEVVALPAEGAPAAPSRADAGSEARPLTDDPVPSPSLVLVPLPWPEVPRYPDLLFEGNNPLLRRSLEGGAPPGAAEVAQRWRRVAAGSGRIFVLRDSLFSQQDHPYRRDAVSPMLPPGWITAAVSEVMRGATPVVPEAPAPEEDGRWRRLGIDAAFGSFPRSPTLYERAATSLCIAPEAERHQVVGARRMLGALAAHARALAAAAGGGPEAAARAGAERIAAGDVAYFGPELRRMRVVPILVENPSRHEVRLGKGLLAATGATPEPGAPRLVRSAILRRRLADGDVAIERYDLGLASDRRRAARVAGDVLVPGEHLVWIWVTGPDAGTGLARVRAAARDIASFRDELARRGIDVERVRFVYRPGLEPAVRCASGEELAAARAILEPLGAAASGDAACLEVLAGRAS